MCLFGSDKFQIEPIEHCKDDNELYAKEQYWIDYYNSCETGYNVAHGGLGRPYAHQDAVLDIYSSLNNMSDTAAELNIHPQTVQKILLANGIVPKTSQDINHDKYGVSVDMIEDDGTITRTFESFHDAARSVIQSDSISAINTAATHISEVCREKRKSAYGRKWRYHTKDHAIDTQRY